jgi:hypothetical protein
MSAQTHPMQLEKGEINEASPTHHLLEAILLSPLMDRVNFSLLAEYLRSGKRVCWYLRPEQAVETWTEFVAKCDPHRMSTVEFVTKGLDYTSLNGRIDAFVFLYDFDDDSFFHKFVIPHTNVAGGVTLFVLDEPSHPPAPEQRLWRSI